MSNCPAGLKKATNYYNRLEAIRDFRKVFNQAVDLNLFDKAIIFYPSENAGWRTIDKATNKIRKLISEVTQVVPADGPTAPPA